MYNIYIVVRPTEGFYTGGFFMKSSNQINFYDFGEIEIVVGESAHSFPTHIHQSLCVGLITHGSVEFICENHKAILTKGEVYVIPPFTPHSLSAVNGGNYAYTALCLKNVLGGRNKRNDFCQNNIYEKDYIALAKSFIQSRLEYSFDLQALSEHVCVSKFHLIREFKKRFGVSPYQFYLSEKVKKIRQGLVLKQSLSDLTFALGFSDQSHLCNTFRKFMGITPLQFNCTYTICHSSAGENVAKM